VNSKHKNQVLQGELAVEFKTVSHMVELYCNKYHTGQVESEGVCSQCVLLRRYAEVKLDRCPYGEQKPACNKCPIHCYKPQEKEKVRMVMRYAGPRMLLHHPILAIRHLRHEKRAVPKLTKQMSSNRHKRKMA
jgi:hypothetical protein